MALLWPHHVVPKVEKCCPSPHELSHVAKELENEAVEEALGVMAVGNERCTQTWLPVMNLSVNLVLVRTTFEEIASRPFSAWKCLQRMLLQALKVSWKCLRTSSSKGHWLLSHLHALGVREPWINITGSRNGAEGAP